MANPKPRFPSTHRHRKAPRCELNHRRRQLLHGKPSCLFFSREVGDERRSFRSHVCSCILHTHALCFRFKNIDMIFLWSNYITSRDTMIQKIWLLAFPLVAHPSHQRSTCWSFIHSGLGKVFTRILFTSLFKEEGVISRDSFHKQGELNWGGGVVCTPTSRKKTRKELVPPGDHAMR